MNSHQSHNAAAHSTVITIDGPAGAGKSSVARILALRLGYEFLDTGAMYRCVTLAVLRSGISLTDLKRVETLASRLSIEFNLDTVLLNGEDVSAEIRTPKIAAAIGLIADNLAVRKALSQLQRAWVNEKCVVTEGRDQGTEVFPDAVCKIFLVASPEERARRRKADLAERGIEMTLEDVLAQQQKRDDEDAARPLGALRKAADAIEVCTDGLSLEEVVESLLPVVHARIHGVPRDPSNAGLQASSPDGGTIGQCHESTEESIRRDR